MINVFLVQPLKKVTNLLRKYGYKYDKLNRLLEAYYQKPEDAAPERNSYNEQLTYDKNGNIKTLMRHGDYDEANTTIRIDELEYVYDGYDKNRLLKVIDHESNSSGFKDSPDNETDDYTYDDFGNMLSDRNKGIMGITYNHLNLPVGINFGINQFISYLYTASGVKVKKTVTLPPKRGLIPRVFETDYLDGYQYQETNLQFFPTAEGYVDHTPTDANRFYNYVYQYKDHLGNIRMNYAVDPADNVLKIKEENHYYPFGLKHQNYNNDRLEFSKFNEGVRLMGFELLGEEEPPFQVFTKAPYNYKYNAKEWQDELGLNVTAMDWRQYDPAIGRFLTIDPEAEDPEQIDISPYAFAFNNPVMFNDPDGRNPIKGLIKKILKSFADDGVKLVAKTTKGQYKPVTRTQAKKILKQGGSVTKTGQGSNKQAKKLMKEANPDSRVVRGDGHELKNAQGEKTGKTGLDHYQKKSGDGSHVFYINSTKTVAVGAAAGAGSEASAENSSDKTREVANKAVELGAKVSDNVENFGTKIFGDNDFGKLINDLNPMNIGFSDLFKAADDTLNNKKSNGK